MKHIFTIFIFCLIFNMVYAVDNKKLIAVDSTFTIGRLSNGMTYYIKHNTYPERAAEFYLVHNVGALQEDDNQIGLAHFLEHLAFNGTKNFPKKEMISSLEKRGVKFGLNINAYTSVDRTVYMLKSIPTYRSSLIDTALLILHDWSHYINCDDEIDKERGVIIEEWRSGDNAKSRMFKKFNAVEQTGSKYEKRDIIGNIEALSKFEHEDLLNFYYTWYRTDLQAIIVVGDIEPKDIENRIIKMFSKIPLVDNALHKESYGIPNNEKPIVKYVTDADTKSLSARVIIKYPVESVQEMKHISFLKNGIIESIFSEMMNARENNLGNNNYLKAAIPQKSQIYGVENIFKITGVPKGRNLDGAIIGILKEFEKVIRYGFSEEEFDEALISVRVKMKKDLQRHSYTENRVFANLAVETFTKGQPLINIDKYYQSNFDLLDEVTLDDVNDFVKCNIGYTNRIIAFGGNENDINIFPKEERIIEITDSLRNSKIEPYVFKSKYGFKFEYDLSPKTISEYKSDYDGAVEVDLSGNRKIIWINNGRKGERIRLNAFRRGGYSSELDSNLILSRLTNQILNNLIVNNMGKVQFANFCADNQIILSPSMTREFDNWNGSFVENSAEVFFKTLLVYMDRVSIRPKILKQFKMSMVKNIGNNRSNYFIFKDSCYSISYKQDLSNRFITVDDINDLTINDIMSCYQRHFSTSENFVFVFEGPMDFMQAKPFIEKYMTNYPINFNNKKEKFVKRDLKWNKGIINLRMTDKRGGSQAKINVVLKSLMPYNDKNFNTSRILSAILRTRYLNSIREEKSGTYSISVSDNFIYTPKDHLVYDISFATSPLMVDELLSIVWYEIEDLAKNGPTSTEIENVKKFYERYISQIDPLEFRKSDEIIAKMKFNKDVDLINLMGVKEVSALDVKKLSKKLLNNKNHSTFVFMPNIEL